MFEVVIELVLETGAIGPAIMVVAFLSWKFGVRNPFMLSLTSLLLGGLVGVGLNMLIAKMLDRHKREAGKPRRRFRKVVG